MSILKGVSNLNKASRILTTCSTPEIVLVCLPLTISALKIFTESLSNDYITLTSLTIELFASAISLK